MALQRLSISDEAIARFRASLNYPSIREAWISREEDKWGEVVLVLNFPNAESAKDAWNKRQVLMLGCLRLGLAQEIVMTVRGYKYGSVSSSH